MAAERASSRKVTSFMRVQEPRWIVAKRYRDRVWTLTDSMLTVSTDERRKFNTYFVQQGKAWSGKLHGIQVETQDGKWMKAVANNKTQWAMWMQAFQNLNPVKDTRSTPAKVVSFSEHVRVRTIPAADDEDDMATNSLSDDEDR